MTAREAFLAGDRPDDVLIYLADAAVSSPEALADHGESVPGGTVLVLPGERGREVFQTATGIDPMAFAREAGATEGSVAADLTDATCPADAGDDHGVRFVFAFVEAENEDAGGRYAEGDVVHAYVACACGQAYADRWVAGERA